jgi:ATP-dependent exoDNAse (exonuclease V) alpha subunit
MNELDLNFELDQKNIEFNHAVKLVNSTNKLIYLTGKAGTGKTTFLRYIKNTTHKQTVVLAPTGVAALNAGGQTIHSFFNIAPGFFIPNDERLRTSPNPDSDDKRTIFDYFRYRREKLELINEMELLIIDEVSMVRCDLLDLIDRILRVFRDKLDEAFGGVQVLLIGDAFQLPPIARNNEWIILNKFYETPYFFHAQILKEIKPIYIELKKIYRQKDSKFIELLNKIRVNNLNDEDMELLNSRFIPSEVKNENQNYITLASHNNIAEDTNFNKLQSLETELKQIDAKIVGNFPEMMMPTDKVLKLKVGAQIMFVKNDPDKKYYNGKIGIITKISRAKLTIKLPEKVEIEISKFTWENINYSWNPKELKVEQEIIGTFRQFPVRLAWAITVHKSQGLTLSNVIADLKSSFSPGQVYVALSRCTSLDGLILKSKINKSVISTDLNVLKFADSEIKLNPKSDIV